MINTQNQPGVTHLVISRANKKNALTRDMYQALADGVSAAAADTSVNAIVLSGDGGVFTAGNDLDDFRARATDVDPKPSAGLAFIETLNGEEARECGLVSRTVDDGLAVEEALAQARRLAAKPREALRASKRLIKAPWQDMVREALERERSVFAERLRSEDCRAALARMDRR